MEGPAGTSITYVQNLCSDFIAAEGGQIVILQRFSHQPVTIEVQITHNIPKNPPLLSPRNKKTAFPQLSKAFFLRLKATWQPPGSTWGPPGTT